MCNGTNCQNELRIIRERRGEVITPMESRTLCTINRGESSAVVTRCISKISKSF